MLRVFAALVLISSLAGCGNGTAPTVYSFTDATFDDSNQYSVTIGCQTSPKIEMGFAVINGNLLDILVKSPAEIPIYSFTARQGDAIPQPAEFLTGPGDYSIRVYKSLDLLNVEFTVTC